VSPKTNIYIGRTSQENPKIRIYGHRTSIRHSMDIIKNRYSNKKIYKTKPGVINAYDSLEYGCLRFRIGAPFKIGLILSMMGYSLEDIGKEKNDNLIKVS
jgi:hypothetical protein